MLIYELANLCPQNVFNLLCFRALLKSLLLAHAFLFENFIVKLTSLQDGTQVWQLLIGKCNKKGEWTSAIFQSYIKPRPTQKVTDICLGIEVGTD